MISLEITARLALSLFLLWCLFAYRKIRWTRIVNTMGPALAAWSFAVLGELKGVPAAGFFAAVFSTASALGFAAAEGARIEPGSSSPALVFTACTVAFLSGLGCMLAAVAVTLVAVALEGRTTGLGALVGRAGEGVHFLRVRAQSIRGVIGRVENTFERFDIKPTYMAVDHDNKEKEIRIAAEFSLPPDLPVRKLAAALQEIEGIIKFVLE